MISHSISNFDIFDILKINKYNVDEMWFSGISTIDQAVNNTVIFIRSIDKEKERKILTLENCLIITEDDKLYDFKTVHVMNTRLAMAKTLNFISNNRQTEFSKVSSSAVVSIDAKIGNNVVIEDFVYIDSDVIIGNNVCIKHGAKILKYSSIGDNCIIRENSIIGGQGFGVEKDENGNNLKISHLGGVQIYNNVEIGALNTVVSGTINPTIVEEFVKTDDHVHIAHNCHIKKNANITAGVIISGSVIIGENVYVGPNSTIKNSQFIEKDNFIGIGTVITKSIVSEDNIYAGVPGKQIDDLIKERNAIKFLKENINVILDKIN